MGKTARNIFWGLAAIVAVVAILNNLAHLATASMLFILGAIQTEED
jgi:hypothetical protein